MSRVGGRGTEWNLRTPGRKPQEMPTLQAARGAGFFRAVCWGRPGVFLGSPVHGEVRKRTGASSYRASVEERQGGFRWPLQLRGTHPEPLFSPLSCQILTPTQEKEAPCVRCCGHFLFRRLQPVFRFAE